MISMFYGNKEFNQDIGSWDISKVDDMSYMFAGATSFNQDVGSWDVGNVKNMICMFYNSTEFNQDIGNWDVGKVDDMSGMFHGATSFNEVSICKWSLNQEGAYYDMFKDAGAYLIYTLKLLDKIDENNVVLVNNWTVPNEENVTPYTTHDGIFRLKEEGEFDYLMWELDDDGVDYSIKTTFVDFIFVMIPKSKEELIVILKQDYVTNWYIITTLIEDMSNIFSSFDFEENDIDITNWDVSNVTNMYQMFWYNDKFNQDIGSWDVSNVVNMRYMFSGATSFNQDIGRWDICNVKHMNNMFDGATSFNQDITNWKLREIYQTSNMLHNVHDDMLTALISYGKIKDNVIISQNWNKCTDDEDNFQNNKCNVMHCNSTVVSFLSNTALANNRYSNTFNTYSKRVGTFNTLDNCNILPNTDVRYILMKRILYNRLK
jgi:surface protein